MKTKKVISKNVTEKCTFFTFTHVRQTCFAYNFVWCIFNNFFNVFSSVLCFLQAQDKEKKKKKKSRRRSPSSSYESSVSVSSDSSGSPHRRRRLKKSKKDNSETSFLQSLSPGSLAAVLAILKKTPAEGDGKNLPAEGSQSQVTSQEDTGDAGINPQR
jgi:hypothetical protein